MDDDGTCSSDSYSNWFEDIIVLFILRFLFISVFAGRTKYDVCSGVVKSRCSFDRQVEMMTYLLDELKLEPEHGIVFTHAARYNNRKMLLWLKEKVREAEEKSTEKKERCEEIKREEKKGREEKRKEQIKEKREGKLGRGAEVEKDGKKKNIEVNQSHFLFSGANWTRELAMALLLPGILRCFNGFVSSKDVHGSNITSTTLQLPLET